MTDNTNTTSNPVAQQITPEQIKKAVLALAKLKKLAKRKHRGQNPGAFGKARITRK